MDPPLETRAAVWQSEIRPYSSIDGYGSDINLSLPAPRPETLDVSALCLLCGRFLPRCTGRPCGMRSIAILDVDGTLVDTNYQHAIAWFRAFRRFDVT